MTWVRVFFTRLVALFKKGRLEQELDEEFHCHLEMLVEENVRAGMSPEEARYAARRGFGGVEQVKEVYRERRGLPMIETLFQDLRYGLRMLRKSAGFTVVAVATLALGIGANTAIFTVIDAMLLRPLPVRDPGQLVQLADVGLVRSSSSFSYPAFKRFRDENHVLLGVLAVSQLDGLDARMKGEAESVDGQLVSGNFFSLLGVDPVVGQTFTAEDDKATGAAAVAVISYGY